MLTLWMFGSDLESTWGEANFIIFYCFSAFFSGLISYLYHITVGNPLVGIVGASGALYAIMAAYALMWPNREVLFMFFPMKVKYMVLILMLMMIFVQENNVSYITHFGGLIAGFLFFYLKVKNKINFSFKFSLKNYLHRKRMKRLQEEWENRNNVKEKVDELLDKISKHGMKSLSKKEKQFLKEASTNHYND